MPAHIVDVKGGKFESATGRADLAASIDALIAQPGDVPLVVHFHGGLVNKATGSSIADRLKGPYTDAGGYPLFFVWQAGWNEIVANNAPDVLRDGLEALMKGGLETILKRALGIVAGKLGFGDGTRSIGAVTPAEVDAEIDRLNTSVAPQEPFKSRGVITADAQLSESEINLVQADLESDPELMELSLSTNPDAPEVIDETGTKAISPAALALAIIRISVRTLDRFRKGRDHGVYCTVFEEVLVETYIAKLGQMLQWNLMKQDTADAFDGPAQERAGTALVEEIARWHAQKGSGRVVLVGHSTGAVYIGNLLRAAKDLSPDITFDIALLAPACTFKFWADVMKDHGDRVGNLRLFGMSDETESKDQVVKRVFPRSLLYLVSGALEENERDRPVLGMERYFVNAAYDDVPEVMAVRQQFAATPNSFVWSKTLDSAGDGLMSGSLAHGDFDDDPQTIRSLEHLIRSGYGA